MTTLAPGDGAPDSGGAVESFQEDPYEGLRKLLPKLVQPSWHKHAHSGMYHENRHRHETPSPAVEKAKRREQRKKSRLGRALAGEHTRSSRAAA